MWCVSFSSSHKKTSKLSNIILHQFEGLHKLWDTPNINLGNTNQRILKKSFSVPIDAFFWNQAIIDDNENLYVGNNTLGVVQKFDRNGKFIESINIKDDIYMIKSEKDEIHVYAGKFDNIDYQILSDKIITKKISDQEMDNINSDKREKVVGNLWIHNGKIIFLKASLFPIDPEIIACIGIIMEGVMFIKKSRKSCI